MALPLSGYAVATATNPPSSLTDFSLLVDLSKMPTEWWAAAEDTTGNRGRAAKATGEELPSDWIDYNHGAQTGFVRVLWSGELSDSGSQAVRIYPPQAANSAYAANATYGQYNAYDSFTEAYWPLSDDGTWADRTGNHSGVSEEGTPGTDTGKVGDGMSCNGAEGVNTGNGWLGGETAITITCWFKASSAAADSDLLSVPTHGVEGLLLFRDEYTSGDRFACVAEDSGGDNFPGLVLYSSDNSASAAGAWQHVALRLDFPSSQLDFFFDGFPDSDNP